MTANPTLLSMPLAQNGQKNVIPETQATPGNGLFSQSTGFPSETSLPLGAGGIAPSREDFNGMANLLGGVAFMAQKGFTFNYDATQDYYTGCIVIDPDDGLRYVCVADMTAGTVAPHLDTANTYWEIFKSGLDAEKIPAFNHRDVITTSGTYTAPVTGWYRITVKGGGGGGAGGHYGSSQSLGGGGGGEGGTTIAYEFMTASDAIPVIIGGGGAGATGSSSSTVGTAGGNSSVTVGLNTYTGGGGGIQDTDEKGALGGTGTINGCPGGIGYEYDGSLSNGGNGGGNGGGSAGYGNTINGGDGVQGGGGGGAGAKASTGSSKGGNGGDGFVWFEYFDTSLNP